MHADDQCENGKQTFGRILAKDKRGLALRDGNTLGQHLNGIVGKYTIGELVDLICGTNDEDNDM
jgi:hypothetical protein